MSENDEKRMQIEVSLREAVLLNNALNEICHGPNAIDEEEFHARTGSTPNEARSLLDRLGSAIDAPGDLSQAPRPVSEA